MIFLKVLQLNIVHYISNFYCCYNNRLILINYKNKKKMYININDSNKIKSQSKCSKLFGKFREIAVIN